MCVCTVYIHRGRVAHLTSRFRMLRLLSHFWTCLLFCVGYGLHCGDARVLTEVQAGPLYRMAGSRLSISCNVSGFIDVNSRKEFEFRVTKPPKAKVLNIISTADEDFGYNMYRVRGDDITVTRVSPNSVLFEIQSLRKDDEGEYECAVINSEKIYSGTYSAAALVKVIDNSLSVSSPDSTSLSFNEGESLALTCRASSNTIQHTHLSVAWYLHKDGEDNARLILSLERDFTLRSGHEFQGRYQAGLIRLDKLGEAAYRLTVDRLEVADRGRVYCQAQEWIQDPDLSWYSLTRMTTREMSLDVQGKADLVPDGTSVVVRLSVQQTSLQEGQKLLLTCSVDTQKLEEKFFSVAWLQAGVELARIGPTGVLSVKSDYSQREKQGELRASRIGDREYRLVLQSVTADDQGGYICRAWPQERGQHGAFVQGAAQDSAVQLVSVSAPASGLSVDMQNSVHVNEGGKMTLNCTVHGVKSHLSVAWQRKVTSTAAFTSVASLSQEGVMETAAEITNQVRLTRPAADVFILELDEVSLADSGAYQCVVSEWNGHNKTNSQSQTAMLTVAPTESLVAVRLISRSNMVTIGDNVELMCRVKGPRIPVTLTWILQRGPSARDNILTLYSDGAISWSGEQHRYQLRIENTPTERIYFLLINGASHSEAGSYQCQVSVFQNNVYKKLPPSNPTAVMVQNPESDLTLTSSPALTTKINSDISIKCSVNSSRSGSSRHAVTWILQNQIQNITIANSDRDSSVTFGPTVEEVHSQRISIQQTKGPSFQLTIRNALTSDQGTYVCEVVEWLQDPSGKWYHLTPVSGTTRLTLIEPVNDLLVDPTRKWVTAREGDEVQLKCDLISDAPSPSVFYKITWFYTSRGSPAVNSLLQMDHTGLLRYPKNQGLHGLQGRLRLSRPDPRTFGLTIQKVHEEDSGTYRCLVEQYQLGQEGHWQQKASVDGGPIMLSLNMTENNLSITRTELNLNSSTRQNFTIPCHIATRSSPESKFQVTWFWQEKNQSERRPLFTCYRNATLHDRSGWGQRLRFGHALPDRFDLTVSNPTLQHAGLYSCEVEEWILTLSNHWRKVAVENSGYSIVSIYSQGEKSAVSGYSSGIWIAVLVAILLCLSLVILALALKLKRAKTSEKTAGESLWMEQHHLKTKFNTED
uniref:immunoglobulin superfamily member 3-like isoform X2 n=1 Tax=Doryrhamphus excisus TaxID=161450 RepID=UPI0025ADC686|nr:immunoglobulin superfamily member 3-like isoform X2 [Doryrhamphus excisus]XP_057938771.1 immunoglobulin superfamily member 3-like isoform X2 [Doryrhamphus excisus]